MAKIVILGAGISGHTAAMYAQTHKSKSDEIIVISPNSKWNWIPSNIWVGVGLMGTEDVTFPLDKIYKKMAIEFKQAKALSIHPEGNHDSQSPYVQIEFTDSSRQGQSEQVSYDFLINATGPKLNFSATEGLGPDHHSYSVCTYNHAVEANKALQESIARMKKGEQQKILVGTGHGNCTCQGAAFEYIFNVEHILNKHKVRDKAEIIWISNEYELGDFGIGGMHIKKGGYITHSKNFTESLFSERNLKWITRAHVQQVGKDHIQFENLAGEQKQQDFDFAMLLPPFSGVGLKALDRQGGDITTKLFKPNGFMVVDGDYSAKPYDKWQAKDWPSTYQNPDYKNIFAIGIAFAPPHAISKPMKSPNGTAIFPTPPRTGMPSGVMGREVAKSIIDMIKKGSDQPTRKASLATMGAACIASSGAGLFDGTAVSMTMYPIVPNFDKFPNYGRDLNYTTGEIGLAGHWIKHILHHVFIYKAKGKPFWRMIPE